MLPLNTLAEQVLCLTFINPMRQRHFTSGGGLHRFDFWPDAYAAVATTSSGSKSAAIVRRNRAGVTREPERARYSSSGATCIWLVANLGELITRAACE
jgi:hypothetical protein